MQLIRLEARALRCFESVHLEPAAGLNLVTGDNGAGKTSLLEAVHLMAYGRSFRGRVRDGLIRSGAPALEVFVEWSQGAVEAPRHHRAGLRHSGQDWEARLDGRSVGHLGELCAAMAVVTFEPGSHALVAGASEGRRRYLDWGLFHVEPGFLVVWRRYLRALRQRNAVLKARGSDAELAVWERELAEAGEPITRQRGTYVEALQPHLARFARLLAPELGEAHLAFQAGWQRDQMSLADALLVGRHRDRGAGFTTAGPHRGDWRIQHVRVPGRDALSRGQAKLAALTCILAQASAHAEHHGEWPMVLLDDLASELDRSHQTRLLDLLLDSGAQVLLTGTEAPPALSPAESQITRFHVEQAALTRV